MTKKAKSKSTLATCPIDGSDVRCWFAKFEREICFRKKHARRVVRVALTDIYLAKIGQTVLPLL